MRQIKALVFDVDGTLVNYESSKYKSGWDAIGGSLESKLQKEWFENLEIYYPQKDKIIEWTEKDAELLKGISTEHIEKVLFSNGRIPYNTGAREFLKKLNGEYLLGIVSGGVNLVSDKIQEDLNGLFDFIITNELGIKKGYFDGTVKAIDMWKKDILLENKLKEYNLNLKDVCYVGDSGNDIPLLSKVYLPIVFNSKGDDSEEVKRYSKHIINDFKQLTNIIENNNRLD